jgi:hypothetical protein
MVRGPKQLLAIAADIAELKQQLGHIAQALAKLVDGGERASFTIAEWRGRHGISESQYFKLRRQNRGPRTMPTGDVGLRISAEADREWIAAREAEAAEKQSPAQHIA